MSIEFEGHYDQKILYKQTVLVEHPSLKVLFRRLAFAVPIGLLLVWLVSDIYHSKQYFTRSTFGVLMLAVIFYKVAIESFLSPYLAMLQVITMTKKELLRKGEITAEGICYIVPDLFEPTTPWSKIYRAKKTDDLVVLFADYAPPMAFPRSFFKREADWQQFNSWVNHYVKARG
jgi:hypothetical protein